MRLLKPFEKQFCKMQYRYLARFCPRAKNQICFSIQIVPFLFTTNLSQTHSVEVSEIYSHTFWQKFLESKFLLNILLKSWFHEIFSNESKFLVFAHCDILTRGIFVPSPTSCQESTFFRHTIWYITECTQINPFDHQKLRFILGTTLGCEYHLQFC